jgi:hypothetical protein
MARKPSKKRLLKEMAELAYKSNPRSPYFRNASQEDMGRIALEATAHRARLKELEAQLATHYPDSVSV